MKTTSTFIPVASYRAPKLVAVFNSALTAKLTEQDDFTTNASF